MNELLFDEQGEVEPQSVEALSRDELRQWMRARLRGEDMRAWGDARESDMPHFLLVPLYPQLDRLTREDFQGIILEFLEDLANNPESEWRGKPGDELLMLLEPILAGSPRREQAVDLLLAMVQSSRFISEGEPDLHFRALQRLVALKHRANPEFWFKQFEVGGSRYANVVFEGLTLFDVSVAFDWLTRIEWDDLIEDAVISLLPSLIEDYGGSKVLSLIEQILPNLPLDSAESLVEFCKDEGLTIKRVDYQPVEIAFGISSEILRNPILPSELREASGYLQKLVKHYPDTSWVVNSQSYIAAKCTYSNIEDQLIARQDKLSKAIAELSLGDQKPFDNRDNFGVVLHEDSARCNRVLYLFPFFLTQGRKDSWGVIPFGNQRKLGFLFHKDHPGFQARNGLGKVISKESSSKQRASAHSTRSLRLVTPQPSKNGPQETPTGVLDWVADVIKHTEEKDGKIYSIQGFVTGEILLELVQSIGKEVISEAFANAAKPMDADSYKRIPFFRKASASRKKGRKAAPFFRRAATSSKNGKYDVYIFDPAESDWISNEIGSKDYRTVVIEHGLAIPVGIGFSLYMLPALLRDENWRAVLNHALDVYAPLASKFERIGIELDPELLRSRQQSIQKSQDIVNKSTRRRK